MLKKTIESLSSDNANPEIKKRSIRPSTVTKKSHSISSTPRTRSPLTSKVIGERRCHSLSPLKKQPNNKPLAGFSKTLDKPTASVPVTINVLPKSTKQNEDKTEKQLPPFVVSKMSRALATKKREFFKLRKALISQQNVVLEQYANLKELEGRVGSRGEESVGELRVLSVTKWPAHDLLLLVKNDLDVSLSTEISGVFGPQVVHQLQNVLFAIPNEYHCVATELMARRIDILSLLRSKLGVERTTTFLHPEWKTKNAEFDEETEQLHTKVEEVGENIKSKINYALELAKIPWLDREAINKKIERLQKENIFLQNKSFPEVTKKEIDLIKEQPKVAEKCPPFQAICEELQRERTAREALKAVVATAENMLKVARARIATLERQVTDQRAQHDATLRKQKEMEQLLRQRESSYDARSKKLQEMHKAGEAAISALSQQRDALELRVRELQVLVEQRERGSEEKQAKERSRADSLQAKVALQKKNNEAAGKKVEELQTLVKNLEEKHSVLQQQSVKLIEMERKRCLEYLPTKDNEPSVRETDIWKELQAARMALSQAQEELKHSRADKESFLNSLSRIAQGEGPETLEDKMSIELLEKERTIFNLKKLIEKFQENEKIMERSMTQYENELADLKLEVKRLRNYDCYAKQIQFQDLQTELLDLHIKVECLSRERSALVSAAASRALMLERHERAAELFASVTRARREIAALIDGTTEPPPMNEAIYTEITRSLSSICASAADTWSALRSERARVLRLERAVLSQSLQLEREGRARTSLECRRAQLERDLMMRHAETPSSAGPSEPTVVLKLPNSVDYRGKRFLLNTES